MPTAYSYIRFSTPEQKKGDSLRRQKELSERYAREHDLTLDTSLHLHDLGVSAFDGSNVTRGALGGFLKAVDE
ncbi:MAG TPA: recombinase family protein, partial [Trinickia sp.]|nr:recombinase family protein [Trinickia sp.]